MGENTQIALEVAVALCKKFEGFSSTPYICPAGYPTIGYGTVYKPNKERVTMDHLPVTKEEAEEWLVEELKNNYMVGVLKASPLLFKYPYKLAAITDFAYNLGIARYKASTLKKRVDAEDWEGAKVELAKWVNGGGRKLPGLVKRRQAEIALFS